MKNINFRKPKYIIPLIILPFLFGFGYLYGEFAGEDKQIDPAVVALENTKGINTSIPEPNLDKKDNKDKFDAFREQFKNNRDYSAVMDIEEDGEINDNLGDTKYTEEEIKEIEALNAQIEKTKRENQALKNSGRLDYSTAGGGSTSINSPGYNTNQKKSKARSSQEEEMELFKAQMRYFDSISEPDKYKDKTEEIKLAAERKKRDSIRAEKEKKFIVTKTQNESSGYFNTIKADNDEIFIKALLDEGLKVYQGSRVRVRLMDDIFINGNLMKKGDYLYGIVSNFKAQRVEIQISTILIKDQILPVDLSIYDNDGIEGLYVPLSKFRDFAKELGSDLTQGQNNVSVEDNPDNQSEFLYDMIGNAFRTSSKAIRKSLKANKAKLKYNTIVYLVNNEKQD